jgi:hypothetical protein
MKVKANDVVALKMLMEKLAFENEVERKFNFKLKYLLTKNMLEIDKEFSLLEKLRNELIIKYGEKSEETVDSKDPSAPKAHTYTVAEDKRQEFIKEINSVLEVELEIELNQFTIEEMNEIATGCMIEARDVVLIDRLLLKK